MSLNMSRLSDEEQPIVAIYSYTDEEGNVVSEFEVRRWRGKRVCLYEPAISSRKGFQQLLYRLHEVRKEIDEGDGVIFVVEGEKDADRLSELGLVATCNPYGPLRSTSPNVLEGYAKHLKGAKRVILLADNDEPGRQHAQRIANTLLEAGEVGLVSVYRLPEVPEGGDVSDWLDLGHTVEELRELVALN